MRNDFTLLKMAYIEASIWMMYTNIVVILVVWNVTMIFLGSQSCRNTVGMRDHRFSRHPLNEDFFWNQNTP